MNSNFEFESIDPNNIEHAKAFVSWYKNPLLVKNWTLQKENDLNSTEFTIKDFKQQYSNSINGLEKTSFMIKTEGHIIGYGQFYINHPVCLTKKGRVCWPSLAIGEDDYRGQGLGVEVAKYIVKLAKEAQCTHIEAAIFEFNKKMKDIVINNGFEYIGKQKDLTFVEGRWWSSEHYLLKL